MGSQRGARHNLSGRSGKNLPGSSGLSFSIVPAHHPDARRPGLSPTPEAAGAKALWEDPGFSASSCLLDVCVCFLFVARPVLKLEWTNDSMVRNSVFCREHCADGNYRNHCGEHSKPVEVSLSTAILVIRSLRVHFPGVSLEGSRQHLLSRPVRYFEYSRRLYPRFCCAPRQGTGSATCSSRGAGAEVWPLSKCSRHADPYHRSPARSMGTCADEKRWESSQSAP